MVLGRRISALRRELLLGLHLRQAWKRAVCESMIEAAFWGCAIAIGLAYIVWWVGR